MPKASDLYKRAGIKNVAEFYRDKFFTDGVYDARYFDAVNRFDIRYARTMWVYDNVRRGSSVLDLGCGEGLLALLKRKDVTLTGIDLSPEFVMAARRNGYDAAYVAQLSALPFADASFDYVISLDVIGHIAPDEKDAALGEIKRVLRPAGVTMHGIECIDLDRQKGYDSMSEDELRHFISIDGHIGLEEEAGHAGRFRRFFDYVRWEPRYALCLSADEFLKQADEYGMRFEADFLDYLRGLKDHRAFNMAMGYVFNKVSDLEIKLPNSGQYILLKASAMPLGPFYNEHRDRRDLFRAGGAASEPFSSERVCVDRHSRALFDSGWYEANYLPPVARWMGKQARISLKSASLSVLRLDLTTHIPDLKARPLGLEFYLNGVRLCAFSLLRYGWLELEIRVPESLARDASRANSAFECEIRADRTWQPGSVDPGSKDNRQLSIAVCNIEICS